MENNLIEEVEESVQDLKIQPPSTFEEARQENLKNKQRKRLHSASSLEDLPTHLRSEIYNERYNIILSKLSKLCLTELDITPEDMIDSFCVPEKPVKVTFNDVSAAAYRIKSGVEFTPCKSEFIYFPCEKKIGFYLNYFFLRHTFAHVRIDQHGNIFQKRFLAIHGQF